MIRWISSGPRNVVVQLIPDATPWQLPQLLLWILPLLLPWSIWLLCRLPSTRPLPFFLFGLRASNSARLSVLLARFALTADVEPTWSILACSGCAAYSPLWHTCLFLLLGFCIFLFVALGVVSSHPSFDRPLARLCFALPFLLRCLVVFFLKTLLASALVDIGLAILSSIRTLMDHPSILSIVILLLHELVVV